MHRCLFHSTERVIEYTEAHYGAAKQRKEVIKGTSAVLVDSGRV